MHQKKEKKAKKDYFKELRDKASICLTCKNKKWGGTCTCGIGPWCQDCFGCSNCKGYDFGSVLITTPWGKAEVAIVSEKGKTKIFMDKGRYKHLTNPDRN
ncbi:MAG: hypothetical protein AABY22_10895 [Nanoarchaeota archaeon]